VRLLLGVALVGEEDGDLFPEALLQARAERAAERLRDLAERPVLSRPAIEAVLDQRLPPKERNASAGDVSMQLRPAEVASHGTRGN